MGQPERSSCMLTHLAGVVPVPPLQRWLFIGRGRFFQLFGAGEAAFVAHTSDESERKIQAELAAPNEGCSRLRTADRGDGEVWHSAAAICARRSASSTAFSMGSTFENPSRAGLSKLTRVRDVFKLLVEQLEESCDVSRLVVGDPALARFGLTDAAIATVCSRGILVLTTDLQLQIALQQRGMDALNFNHLRPAAW
jgi:hypothetical protein